MTQPNPSPFLALQHRNFRLLWFGQLISFSGSMMQNAAILWQVSLLVPEDKKAIALGLVGVVRIVPIILFSMISGVVADALDRRKLMLITQTGMTAVAMLLAAITFSGLRAVWPIYLLAALGSAFGSFDGPARQSLVPNLVPREHLPNAISLNTIMFQVASVTGPALGGLLIGGLGVGWAYAFNAVSFLFVIAALVLMRDLPQRPAGEKSEISLRAAGEGLRYVFTAPLIRSSMLLDFFATFFASATALLPIFAQNIITAPPLLLFIEKTFKADAQALTYGSLSAAPAFGSMLTSLVMVRAIERMDRRGWIMLWAVFSYGLATVVFGLSRNFWLTFACLAATGAADTVSMVIRNVIRQLSTPDHLRGRMTSVNMIFFMGGPQLGELEAGAVAQAFGPVVSVVSGGIGCLLASAWVAWQTPELRAYRRDAPILAGQAAD